MRVLFHGFLFYLFKIDHLRGETFLDCLANRAATDDQQEPRTKNQELSGTLGALRTAERGLTNLANAANMAVELLL